MGNQLANVRRREILIEIPIEILLEIVARADPTTLIRFAATSKHLRRHTTDPAFLRHYHHAEPGFVPSLLVGMFRQHCGHYSEPYRFVPVSPSTKLTLQLAPPTDAADDSFEHYIPFGSRGGLLLLHGRRGNLMQLCVCNPVTGRYSYLPDMTLRHDYLHVLLPGGEDDVDNDHNKGLSFRLLVADRAWRTQTFSSETGSWGPVTETPGVLPYYEVTHHGPVVLRGVAHWLSRHTPSDRYQVLAIRLGDGQAAAIGEVPELCLRRRRTGPNDPANYKNLLLVSTDGRQLGLLVAEVMVICLWTLSEDSKSWGARRVVVDRNRMIMLRSVKLHCAILGCIYLDLEWFGEASGAVVLRQQGAGILVLNLRTGEIVQPRGCSELVSGSFRCCPYEVDLVSLIAGLQPF